MFFMDNDTRQVKRPVSIRRRLALWFAWVVGATVSLSVAFGVFMYVQFPYLFPEREPYRFQVLSFVERESAIRAPVYNIFIDGKPARDTIFLKIPDGRFAHVFFTETIRSAKKRVEILLVPVRKDPPAQPHAFEIEAIAGYCDAVIELQGYAATFIGCSARAYDHKTDRL